MRKFFYICALSILFLSFPFFYKMMTQGFRVSKLCQLSKISHAAGKSAMPEELKSQLQQPFYYVGRGMQTFVFESQDGKIVIKFFKLRRRNKMDHLLKMFEACNLAFNSAREETGLLYTHLYKSDEKLPKIFLKNRLRLPVSLHLESYAFVIQQKAKPFQELFPSVLQNESSGELIDAYLSLVYNRSQKGICNTDVNVDRNFGWLEGRAIELDFGNYLYDPKKKESEFCQFAARMRAIIQKMAPEKLAEYDQKVERYHEKLL